MKKVLSLVLTLTLVMGTFSMAFAANSTASYSDVAGKDCENQVAVLQALDVVTGYPDGTYKPEGIVTRAEMATLIIKAMDLTKYASGTGSVFSDVPSTHWAAKAVAYANAAGYIKGYPDGTFKPDQTVSYNEAVTMLVRALGYKEENLIGSWPANYINQARTLRILKDIDSLEGGANRGDIAIMLFNTLPLGFVTYDKDNQAQISDDTMLARLGAAAGEGIITDTLAEDAATDISEYLGASVKYWMIDSDDDGKKDNIVAIEETESTFYDAEVTLVGGAGSDLKEIKIGDDKYTAKGNAAKFQYENAKGTATAAVEFVNGKVDDTLDVTDGNTYKIAAKLSGKYVTEIYSIADWTATYDGKYTDAIDKKIAKDKKIDDNNVFETNNNKEIDTTKFVLAGVDSLDAIAKDNVVYAYADSNKNIVKIEVGTKVVEGTIAKKKVVTNENIYYTIDGAEYEFSAEAIANSANFGAFTTLYDQKAGDVVKLYLDYAGKIYDVETVESEADKYGIILASQKGSNGTFGKEFKLELFLSDGTTSVFTCESEASDKIWKDGTTYKHIDQLIGLDNAEVGTIVKYGLNKDGVINAIEKANVVLAADTAVAETITAKGYINGTAIADDAIIFTTEDAGIDTDATIVDAKAVKDKLGVTTKANVLDKRYTQVVTITDADTSKVVLMVLEGGAASDAVYGVITEDGWSEKDCIKANVIIGTADPKEIEIATGSVNTKSATLMTITTKTDGSITLAAASTKQFATGQTAEIKNSTIKCGGNTIAYTSETIVYVQNSKGVWEIGSPELDLVDIDAGDNKTVTVYDTDDDEVLATYILIANR